jgi:hypothetical protein
MKNTPMFIESTSSLQSAGIVKITTKYTPTTLNIEKCIVLLLEMTIGLLLEAQ